MQSKKIAIGGILSGTVVAGLGVVVLLGGLAEAEQPDRDPVPGYEGVGTDSARQDAPDGDLLALQLHSLCMPRA